MDEINIVYFTIVTYLLLFTDDLMNYKKDFERTKYELDGTIASLENYKKRISEQDVKIIDMEVLQV